MKAVIVLIATMVALSTANASSYRIECSNVSGTVNHIEGHWSGLTVTKKGEAPEYKKVRVELNEYANLKPLGESVEIDHQTSGGANCGLSSSLSVYGFKAELSLRDGEFGDDIVGAENGVITDYFICKRIITSMMPRPQDPSQCGQ